MDKLIVRSLTVFILALLLSPLARAVDPSATITAVAAQTDPAKLATLKGKRAANARLHRVLAYPEENRRAGVVQSKTIDEAQKITGDTGAHGQAVKEMLLRNFEFGQRQALFTDENLALMKRGASPLVVSGSFKGQPYEVDHIIPVAEFPQLGNELANLIYLPRTMNRQKSDEINQRAIDLGLRLVAAGMLTKEDYEKLKRTIGR